MAVVAEVAAAAAAATAKASRQEHVNTTVKRCICDRMAEPSNLRQT